MATAPTSTTLTRPIREVAATTHKNHALQKVGHAVGASGAFEVWFCVTDNQLLIDPN